MQLEAGHVHCRNPEELALEISGQVEKLARVHEPDRVHATSGVDYMCYPKMSQSFHVFCYESENSEIFRSIFSKFLAQKLTHFREGFPDTLHPQRFVAASNFLRPWTLAAAPPEAEGADSS